MIKVFRDGLAVNTDYIVAVVAERYEDDDFEPDEVIPFCVTAYMNNGTKYVLEWFDTQEAADSWISKISRQISYNKKE